MIKVVIIEDQDLMRDTLRFSFDNFDDICVTGDYATGEAFVEALPSLEVDVVLLDIVLKRAPMQGDDVARHIRRERPDVKIIAVSSENNLETLQKMLGAGIDGFVSKDEGSGAALAVAIHDVMSGIEYYTRDISTLLNCIAKSKNNETMNAFTDQELRILKFCGDGLQGKEIAERLNISVSTVYNHKQNIFKKVGLNSTAEAVLYAVRNGLIRL